MKGLDVMNNNIKFPTELDLYKEIGFHNLKELEIYCKAIKDWHFSDASMRYDGYFRGEATASDL